MKLSLRNLALAGTMMVAGAAMAQDAPFNVTVDWFRTMTGNTTDAYRFGTGWDGKVIATNKTTGTIHYFDKENDQVVDAQGSVAVNIIHDDAGNLLFHRSWASAVNDCTKWTIYNPESGTFKDVEITLPEGAVNGRMDMIGRVAGDVLSEDGGLLLFTPNLAELPFIIKIANGEQVNVDFTDYPVAENGPYAFDTTTMGQFTYTYEEIADMGDDWVNGIAIRKRGGAGNVPYVSEDGDWKALASVPSVKSSECFDVFVLNDKLYLVNPAGDINYTSRFSIVDVETGDVVYTLPAEYEVSKATGQGFGSIVANKVNDNKVEIYVFGQTHNNTGITYAGMVTVEIPQAAPQVPNMVFLRGDMNDWGVEYSYALMPKFDLDAPTANENGEYEYSLYLDALFGSWKLSGPEADWSGFNYGGKGGDCTVEAGKLLESWTGSTENFLMGDLTLTEATVTFYYNPDSTQPSHVKVEGTPYVAPTPATAQDKSHYAYALDAQSLGNEQYNITFKATGDAPKAVLVTTNKANGEEKEFELGAAKFGDNSFTFDATQLPGESSHNWAIRLHNDKRDEIKITNLSDENFAAGRGCMIVFNDPESPAFGYSVSSYTKNNGFDIFNPAGEKVASRVHAQNPLWQVNTTNQSNPIGGDARDTEAVVAAWGDGAYGCVAFDVLDLDKEPYSVFEGVKDVTGAIYNGEVGVGSGTSDVAFQFKGAERRMFTFDEDILNNNVAVYNIGEAKTIGTAPANWGKMTLNNANVEFAPISNGIFVSQVRSNGMDAGSHALIFMDNDGKLLWKFADDMPFDFPEYTLKTSTSGVAVNQAEDMLALTTQAGIEIFLLSFKEEDGVEYPYLEPYMSIENTELANTFARVKFDAANNIHMYNREKGYQIITLPEEEPLALTAAKNETVISNSTGVQNIAVEAATEGEAVYYNLNGVRVDADALVPGVYVKSVNGKATKVVVK